MNHFFDAETATALMNATIAIQAAIKTTNNGKLLIMRIENPAYRIAVPALVEYYVEAIASDGRRYTHKMAFSSDVVDRAAAFANSVRRHGEINPEHWSIGTVFDRLTEVA